MRPAVEEEAATVLYVMSHTQEVGKGKEMLSELDICSC